MEDYSRYRLEELENVLKYHFSDRKLLLQAITHSSFSNEQKINKRPHYERIEFLGDAVLELVSSEFLFQEHPDVPEGKLTKMRASMVCEPYLAFCAKEIGLDQFILLGKGEESTGGRKRESIISDVFEAVIGAIYLDGGMEAAKAHIYRAVLNNIDEKRLFSDSKSALQEHVQGVLKKTLTYELIGVEGPEHCQEFSVRVVMDGEELGSGKGHSKKAAEQEAALQALKKLAIIKGN